MNNTMCLGLFLLVMHIQRLPWTYSSEVLVTIGESSNSVMISHPPLTDTPEQTPDPSSMHASSPAPLQDF